MIIVLVTLLAFGLGRLSGQGSRAGVSINYAPDELKSASMDAQGSSASQVSAVGASLPTATLESVSASSKGTKYYYANCKNTISAANKIIFTSAAEAEKAGYTLAANCHR
jgi:hypothetical protein